MKTIIACIPHVNRPDLLVRAIRSLVPFTSRRGGPAPLARVLVIDNSDAGEAAWAITHDPELASYAFEGRLGWLAPTVPLSFAQTQNAFQGLVGGDMQADALIFMHSDGEATPAAVQRLLDAIETEPDGWGVIFTHYDVLCAFSREAIEAVGPWDTLIPWYLADCDWYRRLRLAGLRVVELGGEGVIHHNGASSTTKSDWGLAVRTSAQTRASALIYATKWGGPNEHERYTVAWDGADLIPHPRALRDAALYRALCAAHDPGQGTLLGQEDAPAWAQLRTIAWVARQAQQTRRPVSNLPLRVVETGTARGELGYALSQIGPAQLTTHDVSPGSRACAELLRRHAPGLAVAFVEGDTRDTLTPESCAGADLMWVDGGHEAAVCLHDLTCALAAGVPWVLIDDARQMDTVADAIAAALRAHPGYRPILPPWAAQDERGIVILRREA